MRLLAAGLNAQPVQWLKAAVFAACLLPLARLAWLGATGDLGANPVEFVTRSTGTWTLVFLCLTLTVTPLRRLTGWHWLLRLRRMLGLYAFFYVCLHFSIFFVLDHFFDFAAIAKDIVKRPFVTIGFLAFVLMIPLAATSTDRMVRRLGARRWQALHRLVYAIALFGVIHYFWLVKKDITQPLIYGAVVAVLLAARVYFFARAARHQRSTRSAGPAAGRSRGVRQQAGQ